MSGLLTAGILQQAANLQKKQYALSFDGVDDHVIFGDVFSGLNAFTIEFKANLSNITGDMAIISKWILYTQILIYRNGSSGYRMLVRNIAGATILSAHIGVFPNANSIHHLAVTRDVVGNLKIYFNGTYLNTIVMPADPIASNLEAMWVGADNDGSRFFLNGSISQLRAWNTARTQQQIQDNMNAQLNGNETGLIWCPDFSTGSGNILPDKSPNANHGTIYGAQWVEL